jgi:hypothetical protein
VTLASILSALPSTYDSAYDVANSGIALPAYGNNLYDDCVIAARAHHTVRLDYDAGKTAGTITEPEVLEEFQAESAQQGTSGLVLRTSLQDWINPGWRAGGVGGRTIVNFWGPYGIVQAASSYSYPANDMDEIQVMTAIIQYGGAQVQLLLPESISPDFPATFGDGTLWSDTSGEKTTSHVMLLTGYDENGPIGITWGARQHMTWNFLACYCTGLFVVERGEFT